MPSQVSDGIAAFLGKSRGSGDGPEQTVETIAAILREIEGALTPIIGPRGVAALYRRSLHLASQTCPCLSIAHEGVPTALDVTALTTALAGQTRSEAALAGALLLQTFYELLTTLVGPVLTERLLRSVWANFLSGASAPDTTP
jgi:hypothetical protein